MPLYHVLFKSDDAKEMHSCLVRARSRRHAERLGLEQLDHLSQYMTLEMVAAYRFKGRSGR